MKIKRKKERREEKKLLLEVEFRTFDALGNIITTSCHVKHTHRKCSTSWQTHRTYTSIGAMSLQLDHYDPRTVHTLCACFTRNKIINSLCSELSESQQCNYTQELLLIAFQIHLNVILLSQACKFSCNHATILVITCQQNNLRPGKFLQQAQPHISLI